MRVGTPLDRVYLEQIVSSSRCLTCTLWSWFPSWNPWMWAAIFSMISIVSLAFYAWCRILKTWISDLTQSQTHSGKGTTLMGQKFARQFIEVLKKLLYCYCVTKSANENNRTKTMFGTINKDYVGGATCWSSNWLYKIFTLGFQPFLPFWPQKHLNEYIVGSRGASQLGGIF